MSISNPLKAKQLCIKLNQLRPYQNYHKAEQSNVTNNHLCGLKLNESACSTPFNKSLYSGQMKALPA